MSKELSLRMRVKTKLRLWRTKMRRQLRHITLCRYSSRSLFDELVERRNQDVVALSFGPYDRGDLHVVTDDPNKPTYDVEIEGLQFILFEKPYSRV